MLCAVNATCAAGTIAQTLQCRPQVIGVRGNEIGVVVEDPELAELDRSPGLRTRRVQILTVLPAVRSRNCRPRRQNARARCTAGGRHLPQCRRQQRMPVPIAPVDRASRIPCCRSSGSPAAAIKSRTLLIDRADAAEVVIVLGDFEHPVARDRSSAEDVLQKRDDIVATFRTAEGDKQDSVVGGGHVGCRRWGRLPWPSMAK